MSRRSGARNTPAAASLTTRLPRTMRPASFCSRPAIMRSVVVLPHPEGPSSVSSRPSPTASETSATATTPPKCLPTRSTLTADIGPGRLLVDLRGGLEHLVLQLGVGGAHQLGQDQRPRRRRHLALESGHPR